MQNTIECFTDCSYSPQTGLCVIGYKIGNRPVITELLFNIKNTQGEIYAVEKCVEICSKEFNGNNIKIYTDCQRVIQNTYPNVTFVKVEGHKKRSLKDQIDLKFSAVDKKVRSDLRMYVEIHGKTKKV